MTALRLREFHLEECGCCGNYHLKNYAGDCRNDKERFIIADEDEMGLVFVATADFDFKNQKIKD